MVFGYIYNFFFDDNNIDNKINQIINLDSENNSDTNSEDNDINDNYEIYFVYNFYDDKNNLLSFLRYKQNKLYNLINKIYFIDKYDFIELNNDIYKFNKNFEQDINRITFEDNFKYKFDIICDNIKYEYKNIKNQLVSLKHI